MKYLKSLQRLKPTHKKKAFFNLVILAFFLVIAVGANYFAFHHNKAFDFSYLKVSKPSQVTINLMESLPDKLSIVMFFPKDNEVKPYVRDYFENLRTQFPNFELIEDDKDINPTLAEQMQVSRNGQVILIMGDKKTRLDFGLKINSARKQIKTLDQEFQGLLNQMKGTGKIIYLTRGHDEYNWVGSQDDAVLSLKVLERFLRLQGYTLRLLGTSEGLAKDVPQDASMVMSVGPSKTFLAAEVDAIERYVKSGGRYLVFLEQESKQSDRAMLGERSRDPLVRLLSDVGIKIKWGYLANDLNFVKSMGAPSDRWFLYSNVFLDHPISSNIARDKDKAPVLFYRSLALDVDQGKSPDWHPREILRTSPDTYLDINKNYRWDSGTETKQSFAIGAVSSYKPSNLGNNFKEGHIVVYSDATMITDALLRNQNNLLLLMDSIKWLTDDAKLMGAISTEEDVRILHSNKEDSFWFYLSVIAAPLIVLAAGFFATKKN